MGSLPSPRNRPLRRHRRRVRSLFLHNRRRPRPPLPPPGAVSTVASGTPPALCQDFLVKNIGPDSQATESPGELPGNHATPLPF